MKAQLSFEFFLAFSFLILFFFLSLMIYEEEIRGADAFLSAMSAQTVASDFSRAINGVYHCGSGCSYSLQLKEGYSLTIRGRMVETSRDSQRGQADLVADNVKLQSATSGRYIMITNNNGVVELHDA